MDDGRVVKRTQGTAAGLDRERIAAVAVELVDRDGLERFGVRRLAQALGVDPMSIYHHIKGKAALLDAVAERVLTEVESAVVEPAGPAEDDWRQVARATAHAYRATAYRHPRVFPLLATRPQISAVALARLEYLVAAMRAAGLPERVVADAPMTLFAFLNGYLLAVLSEHSGGIPNVDPAEYPTMAALTPLMKDFGSAEEFDRMLDTVLDGIRRRR